MGILNLTLDSFSNGDEFDRDAGYGLNFRNWALSDKTEPYNSWGNGSAMQVSPIGFALGDLDFVLREAQRSAEVTHNHLEGIKGAQGGANAPVPCKARS